MSDDKKPESVFSFFGKLLEGLRNQKKDELERQFPNTDKIKEMEKK